MALTAVKCRSCGGAVAFAAGTPAPRCLFCGTDALVETAVPEGVEPPEGFLPFRIDAAAADRAFRTFAASSIWYPGDLRRAKLALEPLLLPAWSWSGRVETHWAAIVRDRATRSDRRPVAGDEEHEARGVLVPASATLTRAELAAVGPFAPDTLRPLAEADAPYELGSLTRTAARRAGQDGLLALHTAALRERLSPVVLRTAAVFHDLEGGPLLLPVWIGAYRRGDRVYRIVVNGQSGRLVGHAPRSWLRIGCAVAVGLGLLLGLAILVAAGVALARFR